MAKFEGNIANLRIYNKALSLEDIKRDVQADEAITVRFAAANPLEFNLYNQNDEQALYISEDDSKPQPFILELQNASPRDITLQTPETENLKHPDHPTWEKWHASEKLYHLQLRFRPGTLSERAKEWFQKPALRLAALQQGWDIMYDPERKDLTDWISFLWVGQEGRKFVEEMTQQSQLPSVLRSPLKAIYGEFVALQAQQKTTLKDEFDRLIADPTLKLLFQREVKANTLTTPKLSKNELYKVLIPHLTAGAEGGARGTRVYLSYKNLIYDDQGVLERVPDGSRSQFINIINRQGKEYIPLHVGFVGSNKILNDGSTSNELTLRITNISKTQPIKFVRLSDSHASKFTVSFDIDPDKDWALTSTASQTQRFSVTLSLSTNISTIAWEPSNPTVQGEQIRWSFTCPDGGEKLHLLEPGKFMELELSGIISDSPPGLTNLYLNYEDIPGYWDGRFVCLIEKAPLVYRQRYGTTEQKPVAEDWCVGLGTDTPQARLHVSQTPSAQNPHVALFEGGDVEIKSGRLVVGGTGTSTFTGGVTTSGILTVNGTGTSTFTGGVTTSGNLTVNGNGTSTFKGRIQDKTGDVMPVGSILPYAGAKAPSGWLLCDGALYSTNNRTKNLTDLFDAIGHTYTPDDEKKPGEFRVPDLGGRFLVGAEQASQNSIYRPGATGGQEYVNLTESQIPNHRHTGSVTIESSNSNLAHQHTLKYKKDGIERPTKNREGWCSFVTEIGDADAFENKAHTKHEYPQGHQHTAILTIHESGGGNTSHENRPPFTAINYIIKY